MNYRNTTIPNKNNSSKSKKNFPTRSELKKVIASRLGKLIEKNIDADKGKERIALSMQMQHTSTVTEGKETATNYSVTMINKWCSEKSFEFPSPEALYQLSSILGCSIDYFFDKEMSAPTHEVSSVCDLTGLTPEAVEKLIQYKNDKNMNKLNGISLLLTEGESIISRVLNCLSSFRLNDNITVDILPEGYDSASLFVDHYDDYMGSLENSNELEACSVSTYKDKGILAVSKKGSVIKINEDSELTQELIRQTRLNKLTEELWKLADRIDKNSAGLKLEE